MNHHLIVGAVFDRSHPDRNTIVLIALVLVLLAVAALARRK